MDRDEPQTVRTHPARFMGHTVDRHCEPRGEPPATGLFEDVQVKSRAPVRIALHLRHAERPSPPDQQAEQHPQYADSERKT